MNTDMNVSVARVSEFLLWLITEEGKVDYAKRILCQLFNIDLDSPRPHNALEQIWADQIAKAIFARLTGQETEKAFRALIEFCLDLAWFGDNEYWSSDGIFRSLSYLVTEQELGGLEWAEMTYSSWAYQFLIEYTHDIASIFWRNRDKELARIYGDIPQDEAMAHAFRRADFVYETIIRALDPGLKYARCKIRKRLVDKLREDQERLQALAKDRGIA